MVLGILSSTALLLIKLLLQPAAAAGSNTIFRDIVPACEYVVVLFKRREGGSTFGCNNALLSLHTHTHTTVLRTRIVAVARSQVSRV